MRVMVSQSMYFPWYGFFSQIALCQMYVKYDGVQFSKGSLTNRVQVQLPETTKSTWMTIPVRKNSGNRLISSLRPDNAKKWRERHMGLIRSAFSSTPHYADILKIVESTFGGITDDSSIGDISLLSTQTVHRFLYPDSEISWVNGDQWFDHLSGSDRLLEILRSLGASSYLSGIGGKNYLDPSDFRRAGIKLQYMEYDIKRYKQSFDMFNPFVSILDPISHIGSATIEYFRSRIQEVI
jgi:hypothetical protein